MHTHAHTHAYTLTHTLTHTHTHMHTQSHTLTHTHTHMHTYTTDVCSLPNMRTRLVFVHDLLSAGDIKVELTKSTCY